MSSEIERLRRLFEEELDKLDEYRPNAFMMSRMEEKDQTDQDGDGDNDFDDVRIARRKASGMSKAAAIASVKRKPMGNRKDESLSESMSRMTLGERKNLQESVKRLILEQSDTPADWDTANADAEIAAVWRGPPVNKSATVPELPTQNSPVGSTISSSGKVIYEKTDGGWMTTVRATPSQVLGFAVEGARIRIKAEIDRSSNGEQISIPKQNLKNPNLANTASDLTLVRDGDSFYDPTPLSDEAIKRISDQVQMKALKYVAGAAAAGQPQGAESSANTFKLGDVVFEIDETTEEVKITMPGEGPALNRALELLFGKSKNIAELWQDAKRDSETGKPILRVGWDKADEGYLLKKLFPYKVGKFRFVPSGDKYESNIDLMPLRLPNLKKELSRLSGKK